MKDRELHRDFPGAVAICLENSSRYARRDDPFMLERSVRTLLRAADALGGLGHGNERRAAYDDATRLLGP